MKSTYTWFLFLLSPIVSLPFIFKDAAKQKDSVPILIASFIGLMSYYYVPYSFFDKVHYVEFYYSYKDQNLDQFIIETLFFKTDFIVYIILYIFAKLGITFHLFSALITGITIYNFSFVYQNWISMFNLGTKQVFYGFMLLLLSFSYFHILTGIRFTFATSFLMRGFYSIYINERKIIKYKYLVLALLSHFGTIVFLPVFVLFSISKEKIIKLFFLGSLPFFFLTRDVLLGVLSNIKVTGVLAYKLNGYLGESDFIEEQLAIGSVYYMFKVPITLALHLVLLILVLIRFKSNSKVYLLTILILAVGNFFRSSPTIFDRITLMLTSFVGLLYLLEYKGRFCCFFYRIFYLLIILLFVLDFFLMYASYKDSYRLIDMIAFPAIFFKEISNY